MRLITFLIPLWGIIFSGCTIIPAKVAKQKNEDGTVKLEKPALGVKPFGKNGGHFRLRYSLGKDKIVLEFRNEF
jgi:hypothetical protein